MAGDLVEHDRGPRPSPRVARAAAALAALWLAMLTAGAGELDGWLLALLYAGDRPLLETLARVFTFLGEGPVLILVSVAAAAWMLWRGLPRYGMLIIVVTLGGRFLVTMQKYAIGRLRPEDQEHLVVVSNPSFPSGHAANSMVVWLTIALVVSPRRHWSRPAIVAAVVASLLIGISRALLGVHYPSDVVGGWSFGILWVLLTLPFAERLLVPVRH